MEVFRLQRARHGSGLSGSGAALKGARWNPAGTEIIYTSQSRALAMAEVAVHLSYATLPSDFMLLRIFIPDDTSMKVIMPKDLPSGWNKNPPPLDCQATGKDFIIKNQHCLLKVPSAVVAGDFNILINPKHPQFKRIKVTERVPFSFDDRLFKAK